MIEIPKVEYDETNPAGKPGWMSVRDTDGKKLKPLIRCNCGRITGIGLHHVHADGTVTASYYHSKGTNTAIGEDPNGCGWHVFLKLLDWTGEDYPPKN